MIRKLISRFCEVLRDGIRIWWLAPLIPALILVPEFAQHLAEINLGMFESEANARAVTDDPIRWALGYVKIAGLVLAILASVCFWGARRNGNRRWHLTSISWRTVALALILMAMSGAPGFVLRELAGQAVASAIDLVMTGITLPLLVLLVQGLYGDGSASLKSVFRYGWLPAITMISFAALVWGPLQILHGLNHQWAIGADSAVVWTLMVFDSLVVAMMATFAGTAIHHGSLRLDQALEPDGGASLLDTSNALG